VVRDAGLGNAEGGALRAVGRVQGALETSPSPSPIVTRAVSGGVVAWGVASLS
jgi:hypothetical protein